MKLGKNIFYGLGGIVIGALLMLLITYKSAPGMMFIESESKYDFDKSVELMQASAAELGWKIPHVTDLQKTMTKFGYEVKAVKVFDLCHPDHSIKILEKSDERIVTSIMPCRVSIYEKDDGKVYVSRMNSGLMAGTMGGVISEVMKEAANENEIILDAILK